MSRRRSYTPEQWKEINAARSALTEAAKKRLDDPDERAAMVAHLVSSSVCHRLRSYSPLNQALIFGQAANVGVTPTVVAGFAEWLRRGYKPLKGKGFVIRSFAGTYLDEEGEESPRFKWSHIWDITQVVPLEKGASYDVCAECGEENNSPCAEYCPCDGCVTETPAWQLWNTYYERIIAAGWVWLMPGDATLLHGRSLVIDPDKRTVHAALHADPEDPEVISVLMDAAAHATGHSPGEENSEKPVAQISA